MVQHLKRDFMICCGGIYDADLVQGKIILTCLQCGLRWRKGADGTFESLPQPDVSLKRSTIVGHDLDRKTLQN